MITIGMRAEDVIDSIRVVVTPDVFDQLLAGLLGSAVDHTDRLLIPVALEIPEANTDGVARAFTITDWEKINFESHVSRSPLSDVQTVRYCCTNPAHARDWESIHVFALPPQLCWLENH